MGRPPKLNDRVLGEIGRELAGPNPPSLSQLAKKYKVAKSTLSARFSERVQGIRKLATDLATVETEVEGLPINEQVSVRSLADQLKGISSSLARAAQSGSNVAAKLSSIAEQRARMLDHTSEAEDLKPVAALMETANRASSIGMGLLGATKGLKDPALGDDPPAELKIKLVKSNE